MKEKRLEKAALGTLTARTSALRLREVGEAEGLKRPRNDDGEWLRAIHTPPKKQRPSILGDREAKSLIIPSKLALAPAISETIRELTSSGVATAPVAPAAPAARAVPIAAPIAIAGPPTVDRQFTKTTPPPSVSTLTAYPPWPNICKARSENITGLVNAPPPRPALFVDNSMYM